MKRDKTQTEPIVDLFTDPNEPQPQDRVKYYDNGWRVGTLVEIDPVKKLGRVAGLIPGKRPHWIPISDMTKMAPDGKAPIAKTATVNGDSA